MLTLVKYTGLVAAVATVFLPVNMCDLIKGVRGEVHELHLLLTVFLLTGVTQKQVLVVLEVFRLTSKKGLSS